MSAFGSCRDAGSGSAVGFMEAYGLEGKGQRLMGAEAAYHFFTSVTTLLASMRS